MIDFLKEYYVVMAAIFAVISFIVLHKGSQENAKSSKEEIKDQINNVVQESVDNTINEMKSQFNLLLEEMQTSSKNNIEALNEESEAIITSLTKKSEDAVLSLQGKLDDLRLGLMDKPFQVLLTFEIEENTLGELSSRAKGEGINNIIESYLNGINYQMVIRKKTKLNEKLKEAFFIIDPSKFERTTLAKIANPQQFYIILDGSYREGKHYTRYIVQFQFFPTRSIESYGDLEVGDELIMRKKTSYARGGENRNLPSGIIIDLESESKIINSHISNWNTTNRKINFIEENSWPSAEYFGKELKFIISNNE